MNIAQIWPKLSKEAREWLVEHNGEPLDQAVSAEIAAAHSTEGIDPRWWTGPSTGGRLELSDEAIDWLEERANEEHSDG
ncbi:hypothetical protein [Rhodococcoides yunnanense]|uniref:hypothetical protein n=1 Tax=Rhodococcoides yunnanense TaxID=278209 RepID=UPI000934755A|nr:hypothetical protein [Rhodococcus yunnanensis]